LPLYHIVSGHIGLASATPLGDFLWYLTRRRNYSAYHTLILREAALTAWLEKG
jgi:hypothetical protein